MERYPLLAPDAMSAAQRTVYDSIASGPRGGVRGPFIALLHNSALAQPVQALGEHLRFHTNLPNALLELAILVVGRHWNCAYEWYAHEKLAREAGLDSAIIDAIADGRRPAPMTPEQLMIYTFCDETLRLGQPGDATYDAGVAAYGRDGVLDILALCGYYTLLAMVLNTARPPVPTDGGTPLRIMPAPTGR